VWCERAYSGEIIIMEVYVKVHATGQRGGHRFVIAVCDKDLIGKTLKDGKLQVKVSEFFYKGDVRSDAEVKALLKDATNVNLMGKHAVKLALEVGIIVPDNILMIKGVPHAQATTF